VVWGIYSEYHIKLYPFCIHLQTDVSQSNLL